MAEKSWNFHSVGHDGLVTVAFTKYILCDSDFFFHTITVWKFQDFSATQILREIILEDSASSKTVIFVVLEALNFDFGQFHPSKNCKNVSISKFKAFRDVKMAVFERLQSLHSFHVKSEWQGIS